MALTNYNFGGDGVNLVKDKLQLGPAEATQLQNAELVFDEARGGIGALSKRGGLAALTSALAGTIYGMLGLSLKTTYTRTLYAALGSAGANTWRKSTDGTTWTNTSSPLAHGVNSKFTDANGERDARRATAFRNVILYQGNSYTKGTDKPPLVLWDGTNALTVTSIPIGPSATTNTPAYAIVDMLVANGKVYFAVHDPGGSGANLAGRVMSLDLETGTIAQVANAFGSGTGEVTGGYPCCLCWYQNQLFVGLQTNTTTDAIGKVVRCYPDIDTTWTSDVSNLSGLPCSMAVYAGDLYVGVQSSSASNCKVYKRSATTETYAASFTSAAGTAGSAFCGSLIVFNDELYAVEYFSGATDVVHVKKFDGSSWTTDRDVDANDPIDATTPQMPGGAVVLSSKLYIVFRVATDGGTNGFILQRNTSGTWARVDSSANLSGPLVVLVERS